MRNIISLVGKSGSGKTTLLEKLIAELKRRGHKVAIIKHSHHANDLDKPDKDTWRFTRAGSELSAINSLDHLAIYRKIDHFFDPQEISHFILWDYDIILTEGFKGSPYPKIEVYSSKQGKELLTDMSQLLAVVTDEPLDVPVPRFSRDNVKEIADLIEQKIAEDGKANEIDVIVNGVPAPVSPTVKDLLARTLIAMVPGAANNGEVKTLHVSLRRNS